MSCCLRKITHSSSKSYLVIEELSDCSLSSSQSNYFPFSNYRAQIFKNVLFFNWNANIEKNCDYLSSVLSELFISFVLRMRKAEFARVAMLCLREKNLTFYT